MKNRLFLAWHNDTSKTWNRCTRGIFHWGRTGRAVTQISTHSVWDRWKTKSLLKPLHTESSTSWGPLVWSQGKVPSIGVQMCWKSPLGQHLLAQFGNYIQTEWVCYAVSYLKVPSMVFVEGLEKILWVWDEKKMLDFFLPIPETNVKLLF